MMFVNGNSIIFRTQPQPELRNNCKCCKNVHMNPLDSVLRDCIYSWKTTVPQTYHLLTGHWMFSRWQWSSEGHGWWMCSAEAAPSSGSDIAEEECGHQWKQDKADKHRRSCLFIILLVETRNTGHWNANLDSKQFIEGPAKSHKS